MLKRAPIKAPFHYVPFMKKDFCAIGSTTAKDHYSVIFAYGEKLCLTVPTPAMSASAPILKK